MARLRTKQKNAARPARACARRKRTPPRADAGVLAVFAHDIRTALTGILALGEILASSSLGERERRWAAGIKGSAEHLAALTTLVIDAAKADRGSLALKEEIFRPRRLIEALGEALAARAETKGLRGEVVVASELPGISGRRSGAAARCAGKPDRQCGEIHPARRRPRPGAGRSALRGRVKLTFVVSDSGIGLAAAEIKRLFRPFKQANAEIARRYGGAGLGLAVVKVLAKLMGGDLTVTSTPGRGSNFKLTAVLPVATADAAVRRTLAAGRGSGAPPENSLRRG